MSRDIDCLIGEIKNIVIESKNVYLASHVQPDGDNIGSLLAFGMALKQLNNNINIVKVDKIPKDLLFLPKVDLITEQNNVEPIDVFISLDNSDIDRLGIGKNLALKANKFINIDHHISNTNFGDINIVIPDASSTGEIVYEIIRKMDLKIDRDIATCLYAAISTDTGSFMYESTSSNTHLIAADLLNKDIDLNDITVHLYQSSTLEKTKLFIKSLNTLDILADGKIGVVEVTKEMLNECNAEMEDSDGIVTFVRDIDGIEVACILKEFSDNEIKVGLRSKKYIDVANICFKFGGGGHKRAAGCTIYDDIDKAKALILEEIIKSFR